MGLLVEVDEGFANRTDGHGRARINVDELEMVGRAPEEVRIRLRQRLPGFARTLRRAKRRDESAECRVQNAECQQGVKGVMGGKGKKGGKEARGGSAIDCVAPGGL